MAKFTLECPKCGSLNTASTFLLAKKVIECGSCGIEINVAQSRMVSKKCSKCGKVVVCDQAKLKNKKCPSCGEPFGVSNATAEYKMEDVICPQCSCHIEIDKTKEEQTCPVCDKVFNVKEILAKADLVKANGISVIKYEGDNDTFIWKHPCEDFNMGSQLIVHESQEAIFFYKGEALDTFGAGTYTLDTENLPVLKNMYSLPTGNQNPFHAEVYFINKAIKMGSKWGTASRINIKEPYTGLYVDIGASGEMNLQVSNGKKLLLKLVGTTKGIGADDVNALFKSMILTVVKSNLANIIHDKNINILDIDKSLELISELLREKVSAGFEEYGITVPQFYVNTISLPETDAFKKMRENIEKAILATSEANLIKAERQIATEEELTLDERARHKAQRDIMTAQAEAQAMKEKGFAEAEVMRYKGYTHKDVMDKDVKVAYAEGIGKMGGSGGSGSVMSDVMGLSVGLAAMGTLTEKVSDAMNGMKNNPIAGTPNQDGWSCSCGKVGITSKFCPECGTEKLANSSWDCPNCGTKGITSKCCPECGCKKEDLTNG